MSCLWRGYCLCILLILETQYISLLSNFLMENKNQTRGSKILSNVNSREVALDFLGGAGGGMIRSQITLRVW